MTRFPSFTETVQQPGILANVGGVFTARIDNIPQVAQYSNLYRQYRINWVKVTVMPIFNSYEGNQNPQQQGVQMPRICWAVNDTPAVVPPATEQALLEDNGCRFKPLITSWSASYRPTPDLGMPDSAGASVIPVTQRKRPWLSFRTDGGLNPLHYGISYFISQSVAPGQNASTFAVYYKINFSLRDPQ